MATSADSSFKAVKVDEEEWEKLFDTALVAFIVHKLEDLIQEILGDVFIWCPGMAETYVCSLPKDALQIKTLIKELKQHRTLEEKRIEIFKWMNESHLSLGELIKYLEDHKKTRFEVKRKAGGVPVQWSFYGKEVHNKDRADRWVNLLKSVPQSTLGRFSKIWHLRNSVIHHSKRLQLKEDERKTLIEDYKLLINSDLLKIISDDETGEISKVSVEAKVKVPEKS